LVERRQRCVFRRPGYLLKGGVIPPLHGPHQKPLSGGKPNALVVLLHGVGANGEDLIGLASEWAPLLPEAEFLAPNGPFPCDMAPFGLQWFSLQDRRPEVLFAGISTTAPLLNAFLDNALAALATAPRRRSLDQLKQR
jgi:phospholipase/carboxylesterase